MKKWDILFFSIDSINTINILCTSHEEINILCEKIMKEGPNYFDYVNIAGKHKLEIGEPHWTPTGHHATILFKPSASYPSGSPDRYEDNIHPDDLKYFILGIISSNGWLPYPGDEIAERFIKYYE